MPLLTPKEPGFLDEAPELVLTEVVAAATPDEVWAVFIDNERWPEWFPAAKECRTTSEQAEGGGSTRWIHFDLFKVNERFVAWDPPRRWAFTIVDANIPGIVSVVEQATFEAVGDDRTRVTYTLGAELKPYVRPFAAGLRWRLGSLFRAGLAGIDAQVQRLRAETG